MRRISSWLQGPLDSFLVALREFLKAFVNEVWHLGAALSTAASVLFLMLFHRQGVRSYLDHRKRIRPPEKEPSHRRKSQSSFASLATESGEREPKQTPSPSPGVATLRRSSMRRNTSVEFAEEADSLQSYLSSHTGFFEDIRLGILVFIEGSVNKVRTGIKVLAQALCDGSLFWGTIRLFDPRVWFRFVGRLWHSFVTVIRLGVEVLRLNVSLKPGMWKAELDMYRNKEELVRSAGYPYEKHSVVTSDGYTLTLERIPRHGATRCVYLQHGVLDNSFAWIATGATSLAFRAYDGGADVWMGNFRGAADEKHSNPNFSPRQYWDFSLNEHAFCDIPAFVNGILSIKATEIPGTPVDLTAISHSMGAACTTMYIIWSRLHGRAHHLSRAILLSPAGFHESIPLFARLTTPFINVLIKLLPIYVFRFPGELVRIAVAKLVKDITGSSSLQEVLSLITSQVVGGRANKSHPVFKAPTLTYNIFFGTPVKVYKHFMQLFNSGRFEAFDYGATKNMQVYGSPTPLNFGAHYDKIDIPIHFVMGLLDTLISPINVLRQFALLSAAHPNLAFLKSFPGSGHLSFTIGLEEQTLNYILSAL